MYTFNIFIVWKQAVFGPGDFIPFLFIYYIISYTVHTTTTTTTTISSSSQPNPSQGTRTAVLDKVAVTLVAING